MKLLPDDPKLTAYVLGELSAIEVEAVERELTNSAELRQAVEAIRETTELMRSEFAQEKAPLLDQECKSEIVSNANPRNVVSLPRRNISIFVTMTAIAACLAFILSLQVWWPEQKASIASGSLKEAKIRYAQNEPFIERTRKQEELTGHTVQEAEIPTEKLDVSSLPPIKDVEVQKVDVSSRQYVEKIPDQNFDVAVTATPVPVATTVLAVSGVDRPVLSKGQAAEYDLQRRENESAKNSPPLAGKVEEFQQSARYKSGGKPVKELSLLERNLPKSPANISPKISKKSESMKSFDGRREEKIQRYYRQSDDVWDKSVETARYPRYAENAFESVLNNPLSTFSIDVDTASYANVRRFLNDGQRPPQDAVRVEEMINYFTYNYPQPRGDEPFSVNMEAAGCPWNIQHRLARVGLKGREIAQDKRPPSNFVFLIDVSGSMSPAARLPLIKQGLRMLVKRMTENDRIAIVVYASHSGVVLESTSCADKEKILEALDRLEAGGSTNGGEGIQKAYALAEDNFIKGGVNRVILCTDGDFNVGITSQGDLINLIQKKARHGVFLSALGVGTDNYKDALLQNLADKGNGNYHYLDTIEEAEKVLIQQMNGTLVTIAKDVKIQIEFNPARVKSYRLIGYEKRILAAEDFNNDKKDAGEIGAGHTVTALYEIVPANSDEDESRPAVDDLKYQSKDKLKVEKIRKPMMRDDDDSKELLTLKLRYKQPDGDTSKLMEFPMIDDGKKFSKASMDFRFATAVAGFGMVLKDSENKGELTLRQVREMAEGAKGADQEGYRAEFITLVKKAKSMVD